MNKGIYIYIYIHTYSCMLPKFRTSVYLFDIILFITG